MYASFLGISGALYLDLFKQPVKKESFYIILLMTSAVSYSKPVYHVNIIAYVTGIDLSSLYCGYQPCRRHPSIHSHHFTLDHLISP
jgi:hypothetical protein